MDKESDVAIQRSRNDVSMPWKTVCKKKKKKIMALSLYFMSKFYKTFRDPSFQNILWDSLIKSTVIEETQVQLFIS